MKAPERIWTNFKEANRLFVAYDEPPESGCEDCDQPYILATPAALAASPEVQARIRAAVQAERERCAGIADRYANEGQWVDGFIMAADIAIAIRAALTQEPKP